MGRIPQRCGVYCHSVSGMFVVDVSEYLCQGQAMSYVIGRWDPTPGGPGRWMELQARFTECVEEIG